MVDPRWLLKAAAIAIAAALVCAYLTLCLLVYQGQWQLLLHPDSHPKFETTLPVQTLRFGATETGQPRLSGLWLPASDPTPTTPTILFLPDGSGRLADDLPTLDQLHHLPVNVFAFDYRGFGASDPTPHPTELRMQEDAAAALDYLTNTRHIPPRSIVPYGVGLGASLAANLCAQHPELPALILESPIPDAFQVAHADPRARLVPLGLFFHERFEIAHTLATLKTPKLLLTAGPSHVGQRSIPSGNLSADDQAVVELLKDQKIAPAKTDAIDALFKSAATPSFTAHLIPWNPADPDASAGPARAYRETILRFLNEYLPATSSPHLPQGSPQ
jgi:pimeloyl-ACP methyl ester carboxylesterase